MLNAVINRFGYGPSAVPGPPGAEASAVSPGVVTNTSTQRYSRRSFMGGAVGLAALASFATACGPVERLAPSAAQVTLTGGSLSIPGATPTSGVDAELVSQRYMGLKPFTPAPPPPAVKPLTLSPSEPTVFSRVPLTDKVVFVTIDDGIEKDPRFIQLVRDLQIPITISLADVLIRDAMEGGDAGHGHAVPDLRAPPQPR
jgi:hypothetical protein